MRHRWTRLLPLVFLLAACGDDEVTSSSDSPTSVLAPDPPPIDPPVQTFPGDPVTCGTPWVALDIVAEAAEAAYMDDVKACAFDSRIWVANDSDGVLVLPGLAWDDVARVEYFSTLDDVAISYEESFHQAGSDLTSYPILSPGTALIINATQVSLEFDLAMTYAREAHHALADEARSLGVNVLVSQATRGSPGAKTLLTCSRQVYEMADKWGDLSSADPQSVLTTGLNDAAGAGQCWQAARTATVQTNNSGTVNLGDDVFGKAVSNTNRLSKIANRLDDFRGTVGGVAVRICQSVSRC